MKFKNGKFKDKTSKLGLYLKEDKSHIIGEASFNFGDYVDTGEGK